MVYPKCMAAMILTSSSVSISGFGTHTMSLDWAIATESKPLLVDLLSYRLRPGKLMQFRSIPSSAQTVAARPLDGFQVTL